ncbi:MAG TPA: hypothetical protein VNE38_18050, partial [Ktedonobacteraceae bacterium]|nr:hypothetical protein [Ktedonobacteraceae bacterium]
RELEENIKKLEQEKAQATPNAVKLEKQRAEVNNFLQWAEDMKGRYHEATYDEKRAALRILGITVHIHKDCDKEHERYKIQVGLTQLYSDMARNR